MHEHSCLSLLRTEPPAALRGAGVRAEGLGEQCVEGLSSGSSFIICFSSASLWITRLKE